jgi:hypothetical protein
MKETKNNIKNPDEHQTVDDCSEDISDDSWVLVFENERLYAQVDFILSSIKGGCSPADAKLLRHVNRRFIDDLDEWRVRVDELLS